MAPKTGMAVAAGTVMVLAAPAFMAPSAPRTLTQQSSSLRGQGHSSAASSFSGDSFSSVAAGGLALGALGAVASTLKSSRCKTARAAVLTKDSAGRFRFKTAEKPLVISEQPGVSAPLGFFDPLGFTKKPLMTWPDDPTGFKHLRAAEIKHGRLCMMASLGSAVAHSYKFGGFESVPTGLKAPLDPIGAQGCGALFCVIALFEASTWTKQTEEPGSYGNPFKIDLFNYEYRTKELNNGRMAMIAMMGQVVAEMVTGEDPIQQFGIDV
eukprot:TRINITY_DN3580_c0_g1_i2.p1 TRINITY_DN3580_c0_g1~~TRINITY_DN3580_c0_g1_i2.p1  ORF type:complete len:285 (-),score=76.75 TRINITY_DN3580_c0_g1_i2:439-1239(-)